MQSFAPWTALSRRAVTTISASSWLTYWTVTRMNQSFALWSIGSLLFPASCQEKVGGWLTTSSCKVQFMLAPLASFKEVSNSTSSLKTIPFIPLEIDSFSTYFFMCQALPDITTASSLATDFNERVVVLLQLGLRYVFLKREDRRAQLL